MQTMRDKLVNTYGFDATPIIDMLSAVQEEQAVKLFQVVETENYAVILWWGEGELPDDQPRWFVAWDDQYDTARFEKVIAEVAQTLGMAIEPNITPVAYVNTFKPTFDYELWAKGVKTAPSYWRGAKYQEQVIVREVIKLRNFLGLATGEMLAIKAHQYPQTTKGMHKAAFDIAAKGDQDADVVILKSRLKKNGDFLWGAIFIEYRGVFGKGNSLLCPFIAVTEDEQLKKVYKPMIVAHMEVVRYSYLHGFDLVNFGLFFPYKSLLNFEQYNLPGLSPIV